MCFGAIASVGAGLLGASSAGKAADAQQAAAAQQLALEGRIYDENVERFAPFYDSGLLAQNALAYELGLGPRPMIGGTAPEITEFTDTPSALNPTSFSRTDRQDGRNIYNTPGAYSPAVTKYRVGDQVFNTQEAAQAYADANPEGATPYGGYQETDWYNFQLDQGIRGIDQSKASSGNLFSGNTLKAAQTYGQGLASADYSNYLNRLGAMASGGQAAAGNQANAGANYAAGAGNAYANIGNAGAAGAIGTGNALMGGINNAIGLWNYQNAQAPQQQYPGMTNTINKVNSLFGF